MKEPYRQKGKKSCAVLTVTRGIRIFATRTHVTLLNYNLNNQNTMLKHFLSVIMLLAVTTTALAERVDMKQAGAVTDGTTVNTRLINSTIERLAGEGGGTLFFPAGRYLTGPIRLKSNITLELEAGATLLFSTNFDDYLPFVEVRHEGVMMKSFSPLIYAVDAENITIKGEGTLDGQGKAWWDEFFKVLVDLRDNGKRDVNKYQPRRIPPGLFRNLYSA